MTDTTADATKPPTVLPPAPPAIQPPDPRGFKNYGDCALNLPPDWSRSRNVGDPGFLLTTIGHTDGVSDAFLTWSPGEPHQFRWCAPEDQNGLSTLRTKHYVFCTKTDWTKNEFLWMFDGEGYIIHNGQRLMARPKHFYLADKEQEKEDQKRREGKPTQDDASEEARLHRQGAILTDEQGRELRPQRQG